MSKSSTSSRLTRYAAAVVAVGSLLAGCGGAGGGSKNAAADSAAKLAAAVKSGAAPSDLAGLKSLAAAASQGAAVIGAVSGQLDVSKQCAAVSGADLQALIKPAPGGPVHNPLECAWSGTTLKVDLSPSDADKKSYDELASSEGHAMSGVGDVAQWSQPVPGQTAPDVVAHKGSLTCYVASPDDITTSTLTYTGSDPSYKIADPDALAYATKLAKLCADIFSVS